VLGRIQQKSKYNFRAGELRRLPLYHMLSNKGPDHWVLHDAKVPQIRWHGKRLSKSATALSLAWTLALLFMAMSEEDVLAHSGNGFREHAFMLPEGNICITLAFIIVHTLILTNHKAR